MQVSGLSRPFVAGWHANDVIPAASIVKLPILLELCWQLAEERVDQVARFRLERPRSMADAPRESSGALAMIDSPLS